jgi:hypothetical protein
MGAFWNLKGRTDSRREEFRFVNTEGTLGESEEQRSRGAEEQSVIN